DRCEEILSSGEDWYGLGGHVARAQGEFASSQGNWNAATQFLEQAALIFRTQRMRWEEARACVEWSKFAAAQGDGKTARLGIGSALAIYRDLGAGQSRIDHASAIAKAIGVDTAFEQLKASRPSTVTAPREGESALDNKSPDKPASAWGTKSTSRPAETDAAGFRMEGGFWADS